MERLYRLTVAIIVVTVFVILWGAVVRATGSGAGCGANWPLCNGEVLPASPAVETTIELTHRVTSGIAFLLVVWLVAAVFRGTVRGHPARGGAVASLAFMVGEVVIGAGLVLLELVAYDTSVSRALVMGGHLLNTFLLLGALALTAFWLSGGGRLHLRGRGWAVWGPVLALVGLAVVGMSGAVTALGDTLFPAGSLAEGMARDLDPEAHFLVRLRVYHPFAAVVVGLFVLALPRIVERSEPESSERPLGAVVGLLILVQLGIGAANVALLAPVWMQVVHLFAADAVWIALVLYAARVAARSSVPEESEVVRKDLAEAPVEG